MLQPAPHFTAVLCLVLTPIACPQPETADGGSDSLHRLAADVWGNDPLHWIAGPPTPGQYTETTLTGYALWRVTAFLPGMPAETREPLADPNHNQRPP